MTAKRAPRPRKSPATPKAKAKAKGKSPSPALTESAVLVMLESAEAAPDGVAPLPSHLRRELIAAEAYFRAERRGFAPGHELEDWVAAEAAVDSRLRAMSAA
jgi:hypothetical protein